jgi:hypothetical protein
MLLPEGHCDYNCCLASIHHMPFGTVAALRQALAPGGVLVILGVYRQSALTDYAVGLAAVPINVAARLAVAAWEAAKRPAQATRVRSNRCGRRSGRPK